MMHQTLSHLDAAIFGFFCFGFVIKWGCEAIEKAFDKEWFNTFFSAFASYGAGCLLFDIVGAW